MRITLLKTVTISSCNLFRSLQSAAKGTAAAAGGDGGAGELARKQLRKAEMNSLASDSHLLTAPSFLRTSFLLLSFEYLSLCAARFVFDQPFCPKLPIDIVKRANEPIRPRPD